MPRYRAVLFDLDGTLLDSVRLILDSYHHTLAAHGLPPRDDDHWLRGLGTPLVAQFSAIFPEPERVAALVATYREYNLLNHDASVSAYPGVVEMVTAVRTRGLRTALVTSKNRGGAERGLRRIGLDGTMDVIIGADDVALHKPHPEPVLRALAALDVVSDEAVFVGDSVHDMASGRAAGTTIAAVLWGPFDRSHLAPTGPDYWLDAPADLLPLLG